MIFIQWFSRAAFLIVCLFLSSCTSQHLSIQTDYLSRKKLASYYVNTPDPAQNYPLVGERLTLSWSFPTSYMAYHDLHLKLTIRYGNRTEEVKIYPIYKPRDLVSFVLRDQEYISRRGIFTYKTEIIGNGNVLETWYHQMWVELITIDIDEDDKEGEEEDDEEED
jgi:hypothetical protein